MKNAFKKAISVLLAAVMMFGAAPLAGFVGLDLPELNLFTVNANAEESATSGTCGDNLAWTFNESTGELAISGEGEMDSYLLMFRPWENFTDNIKAVTIGNGVTNIGACAFVNCTSLVNVTIPDSVTSIGDDAFFGCVSLINITIPDSVTEIGAYAFKNCSTLKSITIPAGVTSIDNTTFGYCDNLENITVDPDNTAYSSDKNGVLFNKDKTVLIRYPVGSSMRNYTIPDSVETIEGYAFSGTAAFAFDSSYNLKNVTIPDSVTSIGDWAFSCCNSLTSIIIPDSVTNLGEAAFYLCSSLESAKIGRGITTLKTYSFAGCFSLEYIIIPETVEFINAYAFYLSKNYEENGNIYYAGSKAEWEQIIIGAYNDYITNAKTHYNSTGPDDVSTETPDNTPDYDSSVVDTYLMPTPTETTISYGDSIILHVDPSKIPEGGYVEWYPSNGNFGYSVSADRTTCTISPEKSGDTIFTAIVYDADGNIVSADEQTMTSKAGFFDKFVAFFKKLFGLTKTIPEAVKIIY